MFTGIIESIGLISKVSITGTNKTFWITSPLAGELKIDQSVAHNGICLTVEEIKNGSHRVTAIRETIEKTNLSGWLTGDAINLERCMLLNGRLDGHIVQGHIDATAECLERKQFNGSWEFRFRIPPHFSLFIIEKGSICLNGISLTIFNVGKDEFTVGIIPYTFEHTNIKNIFPGKTANVEFDLIGKYVNRIMNSNN